MASNAKVRVSITADNSDLRRGTQQAERDLGHLATKGSKSMDRLKTAAVGATAALGVGLVKGLFDSVNAARESEVSQTKLQAQLKASGISYKNHAKEIDNVIQKTMQLTGLDDEDLQDAFTNIVRVTGDVNKSLRLTGLAADFARAKHIEVAKAGELVGKVAGGNIGILSRYGIQIDKGATSTEALATLQKKFAGQGAAYGKTTAGAIDRAKNAVENLEESIGGALAPAIGDAANATAKFIDQIRTGTGAGGKFRDTLQGIIDKVRPIAQFFTDHPKLIAVAVGAWAAYKTASLAAIAVINVKRFRTAFFKSVPAATEAGAASGAAYSKAYEMTAAGGVGRATRTGRVASSLKSAGKALGAVTGVLIAAELAKAYKDFFDRSETSLDTFFTQQQQRIQSALGQGGGVFGDVGAKIHSGGKTNAKSQQADRSKPNVSAKTSRARAKARTSSSGGVVASASSVTTSGRGTTATAKASGSGYPVPRKATYNHSELMALWVWAGGPESVADMAAAIAQAESGGRADIVNSIGATGLWQIYNGSGEVPGARDPYTNARMAVAKYRGAGNRFTPWTVYTGYDTPGHAKTYIPYLTGSNKVGNVGSAGGSGGGRSSGSSAASRARAQQKAHAKAIAGGRSAHSQAYAAEVRSSIPTFQNQADIDAANADIAEASGQTDIATAIRGISLNRQLGVVNKQLKRKGLKPGQKAELLQNKAALLQAIKDLAPAATVEDFGPQLIEAIKALTDAQAADTALRQKIFQGQTGTILAGIADMVSGQLGGRVGLGIQTPGWAGGGVRYG